MLKLAKALVKAAWRRWRYRNTDTGRWISKATYDSLPEQSRAKVRVKDEA